MQRNAARKLPSRVTQKNTSIWLKGSLHDRQFLIDTIQKHLISSGADT